MGGLDYRQQRAVRSIVRPSERISPALLNGWSVLPGYRSLSYHRDVAGNVSFRGLIAGGNTAAGTMICLLAEGYRPDANVQVIVTASNGAARVRIDPEGKMTIVEGSHSMGFDGVSFSI